MIFTDAMFMFTPDTLRSALVESLSAHAKAEVRTMVFTGKDVYAASVFGIMETFHEGGRSFAYLNEKTRGLMRHGLPVSFHFGKRMRVVLDGFDYEIDESKRVFVDPESFVLYALSAFKDQGAVLWLDEELGVMNGEYPLRDNPLDVRLQGTQPLDRYGAKIIEEYEAQAGTFAADYGRIYKGRGLSY
jgi:hypothetical protein